MVLLPNHIVEEIDVLIGDFLVREVSLSGVPKVQTSLLSAGYQQVVDGQQLGYPRGANEELEGLEARKLNNQADSEPLFLLMTQILSHEGG